MIIQLDIQIKLNIEILFNDDGCILIIEDNGPGIPNKNYEDVFKPFFTLDPSRNKLKVKVD